MAITRINQFQAAEGQEDALFDFLSNLMAYIEASDGCLSCRLLRGKDETDQFVVIEEWESVAAHKQSLADYPQDKMQAAMPLFGAPPQGAYYLQTDR